MVWQLAVGSRPSLATRCIIAEASALCVWLCHDYIACHSANPAVSLADRMLFVFLSPRPEQLRITDG